MPQLCPHCRTVYEPAASGGPCPRCALTGALAGGPGLVTPADYDFVAELGRGGMGSVTLARQRSLDRLVALKVLARTGPNDPGAAARLLREARAAAAITHPHVVAVHEVGESADGTFIAMEYCEGGSLRERLQGGPLAPRVAATLVRKVVDAVAHAHAAGILHRDLKPSNILLNGLGEPKLSDFGISTALAGATGEHTRTGEIAGSPSYLAPELLSSTAPASAAADVYGLGAVLYECVTGRPPFTGESPAAVLAQIATVEPVAPHALNPAVPRDLDTIILKCLEKSPGARYATAAALRDELDLFLAGRPITARPPSAAGRAVRWMRRNPALAAALGTIFTGAVVAAVLLAERNHLLQEALARSESSEAAARAALRESLLAQARATRFTAREGQRRDALEAVRRAAAIRPGLDARNEALAALNLPDWTPHDNVKVWSDPGISTATPLPGFGAFLHENDAGVFSRRRYPGNQVEWTRTIAPAHSAGQTIVSPDGRWFAVRLQNDEIHVLDAGTGRTIFALPDRPFLFKSSRIWGYGVDMAFSPDGTRFAATGAEGGLSIHAVPSGELVARWTSPAKLVCLAWSNNGRWLAAGGSQQRELNTVALLDAATGKVLVEDKPLARVDFLTWSQDDRWVAVGSRPVQVRASVDFSVRAVVPDRSALHGWFLPGGDRLVLSQQTGQTRLWDIDTGRLLLTKHDTGRPGVWFEGNPVRQWRYNSFGIVDVQTLEPSPILKVQRADAAPYTVPSIADPMDVSPDGRWLLLGGWQRPSLLDLTATTVTPLGEKGPAGAMAVARFSADGKTVWIGLSDGPLRVHRLQFGADGQPEIDAGEEIAGQAGFLPTAFHRASGRLALTHYRRGMVRILDTATRAVLAEWPLDRASHAEFSPDGKWVVSNAERGSSGRAEIRAAANGQLVHVAGEKTGRVTALSPDGQWLLVGVGEHDVRLLRSGTWAPGPALPDDVQSDNFLATFSADSRLIAIRTDDGVVLLRTDTAEPLARLEHPDGSLYGCGLRFTSDNRRLIIARLDGRVDLWDVVAMRRELTALNLDWPD